MDPILLLVMFVLFAMGGKKGGGGGGTGAKGAVGSFDPLTPPGEKDPPTPGVDDPPAPGIIDTGDGGPVVKPGVLGPIAPLGDLQISSDCKTVIQDPGWWQNGPEALAAELVSQGYGLPIYTTVQSSYSVDAVVRTVVSSIAGSACIDSAPWLDRYANQHPLPALAEGQTREGYLFELKNWDDAWDATISTWAAAHPQAFQLFVEIGNAVVVMWAGQYAGAVGTGPGTVGDPPPGGQGGNATQAESAQILALGYDLTAESAEYFQEDYNMLRDYQTNGGWTAFGLAIDTDGVVGPQTRTALTEAIAMSGGSMDQWRLMIAGALEGGTL